MVTQSLVGRGWSRGGNKSSLGRFKGSEKGRFLSGPAGSAMSKLKDEEGVRKGEGEVEFGVLGRGARYDEECGEAHDGEEGGVGERDREREGSFGGREFEWECWRRERGLGREAFWFWSRVLGL